MIMDKERTVMISKVVESVYRKLPKEDRSKGWSKKKALTMRR